MSLEATLATWKLKKSVITASEKLFLLSCARRANEEHECWPSIKRMVEDTGFDRKTIISIRQRMIDKKLMRYTGEMKGRCEQVPVMQLTYVHEDDFSHPRAKDEQESGDIFPLTSTEIGTGTETGTGTEIGTGTSTEIGTVNIKEEVLSKRTPIVPKGTAVMFMLFWSLYPVKKARKQCELKWKRLNLDAKAEMILPALKNQIANDDQWSRGFVPNPLTYINGELWNDEIVKTKPQGKNLNNRDMERFVC